MFGRTAANRTKQKEFLVGLHDGSEHVIVAKSYEVKHREEQAQDVYEFIGEDDTDHQFMPTESVKWIILKAPGSEEPGARRFMRRSIASIACSPIE